MNSIYYIRLKEIKIILETELNFLFITTTVNLPFVHGSVIGKIPVEEHNEVVVDRKKNCSSRDEVYIFF